MENDDTIFSEITPEETEVSLMQGFLTRLIDFAIDIAILVCIYLLMPWNIFALINKYSIGVLIIVVGVTTIYRFLFLVYFNKTIGMMICSVKYLNKELKPLSTKEKLLSIFRTRFSGIKYYKDK